MKRIASAAGVAVLALSTATLARAQVIRPLRSTTVTDTASRQCSNDSVLAAAIAQFNAPTTAHINGQFILNRDQTFDGDLGVFGGPVRIDGTVRGALIVLNGSLALGTGARVQGAITVLGGVIRGDTTARRNATYACAATAPLALTPARNAVERKAPTRNLTRYITGGATITRGPFEFGALLRTGTYNRTEGLPIKPTLTAMWHRDEHTTLRADAAAIIRTASDATNTRSEFGWTAGISATRTVPRPITIGLSAGSEVMPMSDRPYPPVESGLGAFVLRRDYRDWYDVRSVGLSVAYQLQPTLSLLGTFRHSRERSIRAVDAFSLLRSGEAWRPNPLVDDGTFNTLTIGANYDTRDDPLRPTSGWYIRADVRRVMSNQLTPVSLPESIREALPVKGYAENETDFDVRRYLRLDPVQSVRLRLSGSGKLWGDPLTLQRRRAMGGNDPLAGYSFRALNCDRRRQRDVAQPALCDRELSFQAEYHYTLAFETGTTLGKFDLRIRRPDLVAFGDIGSAWLAGHRAGQVPPGRLQNVGEWRSDVGLGIDAGFIGVYVAKALADPQPIRFIPRLSIRF